jgi:thioredoxin-related protein
MPNLDALVRLVALCAACAALSLPCHAAEEPFDDAVIAEIRYPDWFAETFLELPDDAAVAADEGKQGLFLFFSTEGCSYCHRFIAESLGDPSIAQRLQANFVSIGLEIFSDAELVDFDGDAMRVKELAQQQGVQFAPSLLFFDSGGRRLLRLTGYYGPERFARVLDYLIEGHHDRLSLREYLASGGEQVRAAEALRPDPLFADPPYALDRSRLAAERPLLVLFEGGACEACEQFHERVLGDDGIRRRLRDFDVVRLDAADHETPVLRPDGGRTTPADWYDALGFTRLPALAFFNEDGRLVLHTDALVLSSRMHNSIGFVTDRAYERGWSYQRYARSQALQRARSGATESTGSEAQGGR